MNHQTRRLQYFFSGQPFSDGVRTTVAILLPAVPAFTIIPGQLATLAGSGSRSGFIGGGQIGYNCQTQQFVLGV